MAKVFITPNGFRALLVQMFGLYKYFCQAIATAETIGYVTLDGKIRLLDATSAQAQRGSRCSE